MYRNVNFICFKKTYMFTENKWMWCSREVVLATKSKNLGVRNLLSITLFPLKGFVWQHTYKSWWEHADDLEPSGSKKKSSDSVFFVPDIWNCLKYGHMELYMERINYQDKIPKLSHDVIKGKMPHMIMVSSKKYSLMPNAARLTFTATNQFQISRSCPSRRISSGPRLLYSEICASI